MAAKVAKKPKKSTKPRLQPLPKLKKTVQALANRYARLRDCFGDTGTNCISCGDWKDFSELDGGHFIPTTYSSTRFDERNINAQCKKCNLFLHGNPRQYFRGMEAKYGRDIVDDLESIAGPYTWSRDELSALKESYKSRIKDIEAGKVPDSSGPVSLSAMFSNVTSP